MIVRNAPPPPLSRVSIYPQDRSVGPVCEDTVELDKIGHRLEGPRVGIWDETAMKASADSNGNYLLDPARKQFDQAQAFMSTQKTLDLFEGYASRTLPWAFESPTLGVGPHAGEGVNAYYQRFAESLSFYYFDCKPTHSTVQTSQSADVVAHECGHAVLDGLKPEYGHTFERETKAFHEAFGDCAAMLLALSRPSARATIGDLLQDNSLASIGEEFGTAVRLMNKDPNDDRPYLRNSRNDWVYVDPNTLPADGPRDVLSGESHSFCMVWTGAFYDCLANVFAGLGGERDAALAETGRIVGQLFTMGVEMTSPGRARYQDVAGCMLRADRLLYGGAHEEALRAAFARHGLDRPLEEVPALALSADFLTDNAEALGLDAGRYEPYRTTTDGRGYTYVEYLNKEQHRFDNGLRGEVREGLAFTFDPSGRLVHKVCDPPDSRSEEVGVRDELGRGPSPTWRVSRGRLEKLPTFVD